MVVDPTLLSVQAYETNDTGVGTLVNPNETAFILKLLKAGSVKCKVVLVLDFTESISSSSYPDSNGDGISDVADTEIAAAQSFVGQLPPGAQAGVIEFHASDVKTAGGD